MPMGPTAIVMMDTRPALLPSDLRATKIEYPQLAFELNRAYACAHGYDLLYLHQRSPTCRHQLLGERLPSYCKLAAVAEAFARGYAAAVFLDSDAFLQNVSLGVPALLARYREPRAVAAADVSFASDRPFSLGPNAGIQFWSNTPRAARLLRLWWQLPGGRFHTQHDFEQHALQWSLQHLDAFRDGIETLTLQPMATGLDARGWPAYPMAVAHIDHARHFFRSLLMARALLARSGAAPAEPPAAAANASRPRRAPPTAAGSHAALLKQRLLRLVVRAAKKRTRRGAGAADAARAGAAAAARRAARRLRGRPRDARGL